MVNYRVNIWISGLGLGFWLGKLKFVAIVFTNCESMNINLTRSSHLGDGCKILHQLIDGQKITWFILFGFQPSQVGGAGFRFSIHSMIDIGEYLVNIWLIMVNFDELLAKCWLIIANYG